MGSVSLPQHKSSAHRAARKDSVTDDQYPAADRPAQLSLYESLCRYLPEGTEHHAFWWKVTGKHVAIMLHEAAYPLARQTEILLFWRFSVVPRLGPKAVSPSPRFRSAVAQPADDGSPVSYSWAWGTGAKPVVRQHITPLGSFTGSEADLLNEIACKELLLDVAKKFPETNLSSVFHFAQQSRSRAVKYSAGRRGGSSPSIGLEWIPEEHGQVGVTAESPTGDPSEASPQCVGTVRAFFQENCHGSDLTITGTHVEDCSGPEDSRTILHASTRNLSFDHIAAVLTLGGRKPAPRKVLVPLRELWYDLKGLDDSFPSSAQPPPSSSSNLYGSRPSATELAFSFAMDPTSPLPTVKLHIDIQKHSPTDLAALEALSRFLTRRGQGRYAAAYHNVLLGMTSERDLAITRGVQASLTLAVEPGGLDVTSHFLPQVYRRLRQIQVEMQPGSERQRRSRFD